MNRDQYEQKAWRYAAARAASAAAVSETIDQPDHHQAVEDFFDDALQVDLPTESGHGWRILRLDMETVADVR